MAKSHSAEQLQAFMGKCQGKEDEAKVKRLMEVAPRTLNMLHLKPSAHRFILDELALTEEQSTHLNEYGHIGQQDQPLSIRLGLEAGRLRDGMVMVMVAAGVGYAWSASVVKWG